MASSFMPNIISCPQLEWQTSNLNPNRLAPESSFLIDPLCIPSTIRWLVNHTHLTPCLHQIEYSFGKKKISKLTKKIFYLQIYLALAQFTKTVGLSFQDIETESSMGKSLFVLSNR